jgi:hypothetical protein
VALPIVKARLRIAGEDLSKPVSEVDKVIRFEVELKSGAARLQADLVSESGEVWGAYYVRVEKVDS